MDYFKKARIQVREAVKEVQDIAQQVHNQYQHHQRPAYPQHSSYQHQPQYPQQYLQHSQSYPPPQQYHQNQQHQQQSYQQQPSQGFPPHQHHQYPTHQQQPQPHQVQQYYSPPAQAQVQQSYFPQQQYFPPPANQQPPTQSPQQQPYSPISPQQYLPSPIQQQHFLPPQHHAASPSISPPLSQPLPAELGWENAPEKPDKGQQQPQQPPAKPSLQSPQSTISVRTSSNDQGCPGHQLVPTDMIQFYSLHSPQFPIPENHLTICHSCYTKVSAHPRLATSFKPIPKPPQHSSAPQASFAKLSCHFPLPRVRQIFYQDCVPSNSISPLLEYAHFTTTLPQCTGALTNHPIEFYTAPQIPGFAICSAAFETFIRGTLFECELMKRPPDPSFQFYCDVGVRGYLFRGLIAELDDEQPNFARFADKARKRLALPSCAGVGKPIAADATGRAFAYGAVGGKDGNFCQECYHENVLGTALEREFSDFLELDAAQRGSYPCDLASEFSKFAMEAAVRAGDDAVWRRAVTGRETLPGCVGIRGVDEAEITTMWYQFTDCPSIEVCPHCYCMTVELLGAASLFSPITRHPNPGAVRMCFLSVSQNISADPGDSDNFENSLVWRGTILRNWLHHGYDWRGNFYGLKIVAAAMASWPPPCAGVRPFKIGSGRKWFGNVAPDPRDKDHVVIVMCEECFDHHVKSVGTPLEDFLAHNRTGDCYSHAVEISCDISSKRARAMLGEACSTNNWHHFTEYWKKREDARMRYEAVDETCRRQAEKVRMQQMSLDMANAQAHKRLMGQLSANTTAMMMGIGGSVAEASAVDYGQRYGNSTVGYGHLTAAGANAAQAHNDAANMAKPGTASFKPIGDTYQDTLNLARKAEAEWRALE